MNFKNGNFLRCIFFVVICFYSPNSYAQDQPSRLRELNRQYDCYTNFLRGMDLYKLIVSYKLGDETYSLRLNKLIIISSEMNQKYIKSASQFKDLSFTSSGSSNHFEKKLSEISKKEKDLESTLHDLEIWEAANLVTFIGLHDYVSEQADILKSIKKDLLNLKCDSLASDLHPALENLETWVKTLTNVRVFIVESRRKRQLVFNYVQTVVYQKLASEQHTKMHDETTKNTSYLNSMINYTRLSDSFFQNWLYQTRYGIAKGLDTQYLLYDEPIRVLREILAFLESSETNILNINEVDPSAKQALLDRIRTYKKSVMDRLSLLLKNGWQGQFEKQKFMTNARSKKIDRFPEECKAAVARFKESESSVKNIEDFRVIQKLYGDTLVSCISKS